MTAQERRTVVWGATVVGAALLLLRVLPAGVRVLGAWQARVRSRQETLAQVRAVLAATPRVRDALASVLPEVVALAPALVDGRTAAEAGASLASVVGLAASRHAVTVVRVDPLPDTSAGAFGRVALHAELEGDIRGLTGFLRAVEARNPVLSVDAFGVDAADRGGRPAGPEVLRLGLTVAAFYLPKAGAQ